MTQKRKRGRPRKVVRMSQDEALERLARATTAELVAIEWLMNDMRPTQWTSLMLRDVQVMLSLHKL